MVNNAVMCYGNPTGFIGVYNGHPFFYWYGIPDGILMNTTKISSNMQPLTGLIWEIRTAIFLHGWNP